MSTSTTSGTPPPSSSTSSFATILAKRKATDAPVGGLPDRKKPKQKEDIFKYRGRHFGRAIHAFINVSQLITNGMVIMAALDKKEVIEEELESGERKEHRIFEELLQLSPELSEGLADGTLKAARLIEVGNSIQRGAAASRGDDVKGMKSAIVDWIADPVNGLVPPIPRNQMGVRGFNHDVTGAALCPAGLNYPALKEKLRNKTLAVKGDQWPIFLYAKMRFNPDDPWVGFLRGDLVVKGMKHIFTSPSSVTSATRATRAGNASLHGMMEATAASIVYTATLVRFSLGSSSTFSRTDTTTDSELFYNSLYNFITHPDEAEQLAELLDWMNKAVFPGNVQVYAAPTENSALARLLAVRKSRCGN